MLARGDYLFAVVYFLVSLVIFKPYLHSLQLEGYKLKKTFKVNEFRYAFLIDVIVGLMFVLLWGVFYIAQSRVFFGFLIACFYFVALFGVHFAENGEHKKPLVYTKRIWRLLLLNSLVLFGFVLMLEYLTCGLSKDNYFRYLMFFLTPLFSPLIFTVSKLAIEPFERFNNYRYICNTKMKLAKRDDLIKIGITGSYGKTSVKNYLNTILEDSYNVLMSKESYNTPMGVALTMNELTALHEVVIVEMGARKVGDIKELMNIVKPTHTILTGVTTQHLETFKTLENIQTEKSKVVDMIDDKTNAVVSDTCEFLECEECRRAGFEQNSHCSIELVSFDQNGSVFCLIMDDEPLICKTSLIGKHNLHNIALAAEMAHMLGVSNQKIVEGIAKLQPVPHRLQMLEGNGLIIIDDSYNSSVIGAKAALDTIAMFENRKIVVTPGLVELGEYENQANLELGKQIAEVADFVILIGKNRSRALKSGLIENEFPLENIMVCESLEKAKKQFPKILHLNDLLLLLNDLPDNYEN